MNKNDKWIKVKISIIDFRLILGNKWLLVVLLCLQYFVTEMEIYYYYYLTTSIRLVFLVLENSKTIILVRQLDIFIQIVFYLFYNLFY